MMSFKAGFVFFNKNEIFTIINLNITHSNIKSVSRSIGKSLDFPRNNPGSNPVH